MIRSPQSVLDTKTLWFLQRTLKFSEIALLRTEFMTRKKQSLLDTLNAVAPRPEGWKKLLKNIEEKKSDHTVLSFWELLPLLGKEARHHLPLAIATDGNPSILASPRIAIIGSRHPTFYGREMAHLFAKELAKKGFTIVSGGAIGIDTIANRAALNYGKSCAVLGCGLDTAYPPSNLMLFRDLAASDRGLVISEFDDQTPPQKWNFPRRNRTIAALADFLLVIEATPTSGSMLTVQAALDMNCDVGAIPGPVDVGNNSGTNALIRDGAFCILSPEDVAERVQSIVRMRMDAAPVKSPRTKDT